MTKTFQTVTRLGVFHVGELPTPLIVTFNDADGNALTLTNHLVDTEIYGVDNAVSGLAAGATENIGSGQVKYTFADSDFETEGLFRLQIWVRDTDGVPVRASEIYEYFVAQNSTKPNF